MSVSAAAIHDGLSNTMLVGEQSDWLDGPRGRRDLRSSTIHGAWIGSGTQGWPVNGRWNDSSAEARYYNCTTLRYPVGTKTDAGAGSGGMGMVWGGSNLPIQSAHAPGANVARCDGSVSFLQADTDWIVQRNLAIRNDQQPPEVP